MGGFPSCPQPHSGMVPLRGPRSFPNGPGAEEVLHVPGIPSAAAGQLDPPTCRPMVRG